ncbi:MAG: response regulator transcription factor [Deltaproteobacteria bacterium]|nr:MAG: response regulator transcription factor [Deltaproteobacteria bacterium]
MTTPTKNQKAKIFIVDDHPVLRQGIKQLINIEEDMVFSGEAGNAKEALLGIEKKNPDLVIVDISLEGTSGLELTKSIIAKQPKALVLIVSMYDEAIYVERVLKAGAKGYLMKREAGDHIIKAIRKVLAGDIYVSEQWKDKLMNKVMGRGTTKNESFTVALSDRELEVLQLIGQGHSTRQIASELFVSTKTIESHYANIKNKLDLKNSHELIQYAVKWCLSEK